MKIKITKVYVINENEKDLIDMIKSNGYTKSELIDYVEDSISTYQEDLEITK